MRRTITIGQPALDPTPRKARRSPIDDVQPGDVVTFTDANGDVVTGRAWPVYGPPVRLHIEAGPGERFYELPPLEELTVRRPRAVRRRLPFAEHLLDFRPRRDLVVRCYGRHFAVSADGTYAAVEVNEPSIEVFCEAMPKAIEAMSRFGGVNAMFRAVQCSPFLSAEGRRERLDALLATGLVTFTFEVRA